MTERQKFNPATYRQQGGTILARLRRGGLTPEVHVEPHPEALVADKLYTLQRPRWLDPNAGTIDIPGRDVLESCLNENRGYTFLRPPAYVLLLYVLRDDEDPAWVELSEVQARGLLDDGFVALDSQTGRILLYGKYCRTTRAEIAWRSWTSRVEKGAKA